MQQPIGIRPWPRFFFVAVTVALAVLVTCMVVLADEQGDLEKRLKQIEKQMEDAAKKGQPPSPESMKELQKILEEMQKGNQEDRDEEEPDKSGKWSEVPFSGHITISKNISAAGRKKQEDGGTASWSMSSHGQLTATITHCAEIRDDDGNLLGYQAVGQVFGRVKDEEIITGGGASIHSSYSKSDREEHSFDPEDIDGWCKLSVDPENKRYAISFPAISLGGGKGESVAKIPDPPVTQTEPYYGVDPQVRWDSGWGPKEEELTYRPGTGFISGSDTYSVPIVYQAGLFDTNLMREGMPGDSPQRGQVIAEAEKVNALIQEAGDELGRGTATYTVSWSLQIGKAKAKVILEPDGGYEKWTPQLPMGVGNTIKIKAKIEEPAGAQGVIEFKLEDVSNEPGICLNYPFEDPKDDLDLAINPGLSGSSLIVKDEGQTAKTDGEVNEAVVFVQAQDWGAHGRLTATAKLVIGGEEIEVPAELKDTGEPYVLIPKDDNSNSIADAWEHENGVSDCAGDSDEDDQPEGKSRGDGLSAYEEYRGFHVRGYHKRLTPKKKDLFVYDPDDLLKESPFTSATKLEVHYPVMAEMSCNPSAGGRVKVVNFNRGRYHIVDQHGLWVRESSSGGNQPFNWGLCEPPDGELGPPKTVDKYVLVYKSQIERDIIKTFNDNKPEITNQLGQKGIVPDAAWLEGQIRAAAGMVAAHESCHGLAVSHHYESLRRTLPKGQDVEDAILQGNISPSCGQMNCVMRHAWDGSKHPRVSIPYYNEVLDILCGRMPWGSTLCETIDDCRRQIVVSDVE